MNKRLPTLCVIFLLLNGALNFNWAQSTMLTLQEAIDRASTTHPLIQSAQATAEIEAQALKLTNKEFLPEVNLCAQASLATFNNITGMYIPQNGLWPISGPPSDENNGQPAWSSVLGAGFSWEPFTFGERNNRIQQAEAGYQSSQLELVRFNHLSKAIHHWELEGEVQGYVIIIKNQFVEAIKDGVLRSLFITLHAFKCLYLPHNEGLSHLFKVLEDSSKNLSRGYYYENIVEGLLKVILAKMLEVGNFPSIKSHQQDLFLQYTSLLSNPNIDHRTIGSYADALHTSAQNLNNVCRKVAGKSATEILADYIINEAKRWLIYSDLNVTEISFKLEFQDPSYFIKYFKRQTGHTPEEYRSLYTKSGSL